MSAARGWRKTRSSDGFPPDHTAGGVAGRASGLEKATPIIPKDSLLEERSQRGVNPEKDNQLHKLSSIHLQGAP